MQRAHIPRDRAQSDGRAEHEQHNADEHERKQDHADSEISALVYVRLCAQIFVRPVTYSAIYRGFVFFHTHLNR